MNLLIATHNPAKKEELKEGFQSFFVQTGHAPSLQTLDDLHITADPEETGKTFYENARLKAHYFATESKLPTVADDGGIEIDILNGEPGVHSKRWLGRDASDTELIEFTLQQLKNIPIEKRSAQFTTCLYYHNPHTGFETSITESLRGHIALHPSNLATNGFPYRALFIVDEYSKYYDELTAQEHHDINHRVQAVQKLIPFIKEDLLQ
ncbi:non-canonical purine NTP pyrophosphatase [Candidatus Roizmanbacteria bacterium CG17_big_fil_post_rev_8_21_14_2_50_39_7]|uniref:Non-canonical purine NTP pyrophosphatase n=2 Tax=Candidatus Roizmaniibacteriota TaxID=1752723 RepID=A0A2M7EJB4_9BACT|nr:MAG: non-canonical purine NTP pyrophosphatase [Candidatus Roizmanbacteria bacterium CG03_land_8_20_14_0_80_39_12]PIV70658.1 MAG: non-canonical purine NTP pyrophosphatase [Candidatus Roizmanbacteria bacterium CG17_big_fil_post_rev_8_21_14_2_50_39_7]